MFPVQNSTLSAQSLADFVHKEYRLTAAPICVFWRKGMCDTCRIDTGGRLCFLKISLSDRRSRKDVEEEVRLINHLAREGGGQIHDARIAALCLHHGVTVL